MTPPEHPVDETEVDFVPGVDPAWDVERYRAEVAQMEDPDDHPVRRFLGGVARCSVEAEHTFRVGESIRTAAAADYLDRSKSPVTWRLRRLDELDYFRRIAPMLRRGEIELAQEEAVRLGLVSSTGADLDCNKKGTAPTDDDIRACIREGIIGELGWAIIGMSRPLTAAEKKRSGSLRGATPHEP